MAMAAESGYMSHEKMETVTVTPEGVILEEIDEDGNLLTYGKTRSPSISPETPKAHSPQQAALLSLESPEKPKREFGNISPISELLDDDDLDEELREEKDIEGEESEQTQESDKVTPEPPHHRGSFPRISDGRSSPILAYSPSLVKSPPSNGSKSRLQLSPTSGVNTGSGKRPRNIARMLDNISDHSSGEEEVNHVGSMMAKFSV